MEPTHTGVADNASLKRRIADCWYHSQETLLETAQQEHGVLFEVCGPHEMTWRARFGLQALCLTHMV